MAEAVAAPPSHVRRTYLVDRAFQLKYTVLMMLVGCGLSILFGVWMYDAHVQATEILEIDATLKEVVRKSDAHLVYVFIGIALLMTAALGLFGVLITHRVSGPVYVMGHYLQLLGQGRWPRMRALRKRDELKRFFDLFQGAVAALKDKEEKDVALLEDAVARMTTAAQKAPELQPLVDNLAAAARRRREMLSAG